MKQHILLVGFMGSGKSCVSRRLAKLRNARLIDVDTYIEEQQGCTVKQIFADKGEEGFRRIETEALASLKDVEPCIISCGGGVVCSGENRKILQTLGTVVFLDVDLEEAIGRISDPSTRPLLNGPRPVKEIYDERQPFYREVADITIKTHDMSVYQVARMVEEACKERGLL